MPGSAQTTLQNNFTGIFSQRTSLEHALLYAASSFNGRVYITQTYLRLRNLIFNRKLVYGPPLYSINFSAFVVLHKSVHNSGKECAMTTDKTAV